MLFAALKERRCPKLGKRIALRRRTVLHTPKDVAPFADVLCLLHGEDHPGHTASLDEEIVKNIPLGIPQAACPQAEEEIVAGHWSVAEEGVLIDVHHCPKRAAVIFG